ncbi:MULTISPECIES: hypothetical protein [Flammeovirga]|uniref:Uncharacterized protein n=1 Tax=Flammeovirga agarivorans TaxID=2726742 RepID=A0A7X8SMV5_9BACT|nr:MULTISPECIES: hypothetical protein [Flammeovirga]NLR93052.1 hypothetical protein [Flammeovirga agarivorans]
MNYKFQISIIIIVLLSFFAILTVSADDNIRKATEELQNAKSLISTDMKYSHMSERLSAISQVQQRINLAQHHLENASPDTETGNNVADVNNILDDIQLSLKQEALEGESELTKQKLEKALQLLSDNQ